MADGVAALDTVSDRKRKLWCIWKLYNYIYRSYELGYMKIISAPYTGPRRNVTCKRLGACNTIPGLRLFGPC